MTTEIKRDLIADLAICDAATEGPWYTEEGADTWQLFGGYLGMQQLIKAPKHGTNYAEYWPDESDAVLIAESREGWAHAIRRAIAAETEVERLRSALEEVVDVSRWDVRYPELVRCNLIAKEALDYGGKETARTT